VGLDRERVSAGMSEDYINNNLVPGTTDSYYFYANRHFSARPAIDNSNLTLAFFEPSLQNPFYQLDTQRGSVKVTNRTETAQHVVVNRTLAYQSSSGIDMDWLGNNGRLTLRFETPPTPRPPRPSTPTPPTPGPTPPPVIPPAPQTGDTRSIAIAIVIIAIGAAIVIAAVVIIVKTSKKAKLKQEKHIEVKTEKQNDKQDE